MLVKLAFRDFYKILEVSPYAGMPEIKKAVRSKVLENHPDRNPDDPEADTRVRLIIEARDLLEDENKRAIYDSAYFADKLPIWTETKKTKSSRPTGSPRDAKQTRYTDQRDPLEYTSETTDAGSDQPIRNYTLQSRVLLVQGGVPINLSSERAFQHFERIRGLWQLAGAGLGLMLGTVIGLSKGSLPGAAVLGVISAIVGWVLTSYPGGLIVLALFLLRSQVFLLIAVIATVRSMHGLWLPDPFREAWMMSAQWSAIAGLFSGLLAIGVSRFQGRPPFAVHAYVLKSAAGLTFFGCLAAIINLVFINKTAVVIQTDMAWWLGILAVGLMVDVLVFGRTWVFIRKV